MDFIYPVSRYLKVTQGFHSGHLGVDFGWNDGIYNHQPIVAIEDGIVVNCADGWGNTYPSQRIYGNYVNLRHADGWYSMYAHLLKGISVKVGQTVRKGQQLGLMGSSGYSNGQHLHFELRKGSNMKEKTIDPFDYLFIEDPAIYVNPNSKEISRIRYRKTSVGTPVGRDPSKNQIEVITKTLNGRAAPGLSAAKLGFVTCGVYNCKDWDNADGFTWVQIEDGLWCATKEGDWTISLPKEDPKLFTVLFPSVSNGDKVTLTKLGDDLKLFYQVTER